MTLYLMIRFCYILTNNSPKGVYLVLRQKLGIVEKSYHLGRDHIWSLRLSSRTSWGHGVLLGAIGFGGSLSFWQVDLPLLSLGLDKVHTPVCILLARRACWDYHQSGQWVRRLSYGWSLPMVDAYGKLISLSPRCMMFKHLITKDHVGYDIGYGGSLPLGVNRSPLWSMRINRWT